MALVQIHPDVAAALSQNRPVVALESAVVTSGLPRSRIEELHVDDKQWRSDRAVNLEVALMMDRAVREAGATPAMVAVIDGVLRIGLDETEIHQLAADERAGKASIANLAHCCASVRTAGTTVSATLHACAIASIRVFATGGIGGVHRRARSDSPLDVSADLLQLSRTQTLVVSAGAKSILDLPATLEAIETLGIPVLGYRTDRFPQFYSQGNDQLRLAQRIDRPEYVATFCGIHWDQLDLEAGILLANPIPEEYALAADEVDRLVQEAEKVAAAQGVIGSDRTPFLLDEIARASGGRTLRANIALLESNARLAGEIAHFL